MSMFLSSFFQDFMDFLFPRMCLACNEPLVHAEKYLCTHCLGMLPQTDYHLVVDNPIAKKFYGKMPVQHATALYQFIKKSPMQRMLHQIKYKNKPLLIRRLGIYYGMLLKDVYNCAKLDAIVPVPLHPKRLAERGYNQSFLFAQGLGTILAIPCYENVLIRQVHTTTQTGKTKYQRWENVKLAFAVSDKTTIVGKKLLLVDDLITTGSTLTACGQTLLASGAQELYIATLAVAS